MKKFILFAFITLFALVNFACTEVGTNNKVANGDLESVEDSSDSDELVTNTLKDNIKEDTESDNNKKETEKPKDPNSPEAIVDELYKENDKDNSPFFQNTDRPLVNKFFTKDLAEMIWKDAVTVTDEELGVLDFDPLYNAQDAEVAQLKVGKAVIEGNKANLTVTFLNFGEEQSIKYVLAKEGEEWKIEDIDYTKETLKKIYQQGKRTETETEEN